MKATLQTCDVCTFIQFTPNTRSDTTCPYCVLLRPHVAPHDVGATTRHFHAAFCLLSIAITDWENEIRGICGEAKRKGCSPIDVLIERIFPLWRKEYLKRVKIKTLPEGTDASKYARAGWELWKGLNAGGNLNDDDSWSLVFCDLLEKMEVSHIQTANSLDALPLPTRREPTDGEKSVWLANQISQRFPKLTTDQRKWLLAVRTDRKASIARDNPTFNPRDIGSRFNKEIPYWVQRIVAADGHE